MKLYQRDDKLSFRDQGMGCQSAAVLGRRIIAGNENLQRLDLSGNQLQTNFEPIVRGLRANTRLIALTMRNNQLSHEHAEDIKAIVQNHPSLCILDLSNTELKNPNKNKLRNPGAIALVRGILESTEQGYSLLNELHLSYNFLTAECLPYFAALNDPDFIRLETLNLSYNALGPDTLRLLRPMLGSVVNLNLANTKLNNASMLDL